MHKAYKMGWGNPIPIFFGNFIVFNKHIYLRIFWLIQTKFKFGKRKIQIRWNRDWTSPKWFPVFAEFAKYRIFWLGSEDFWYRNFKPRSMASLSRLDTTQDMSGRAFGLFCTDRSPIWMHRRASSREQPSTIDESTRFNMLPSFHKLHACTK
jgi:hypothetical protein